ncbi:flagellar biosynthetic protein FliO [Geodermatophilus sp. DSM 45219]|uniref:flagellar biosynthetic protein FliO n=1 Tax=Geodermatophilus sp. DSM 45219 TaxID=1881103 RepID=UPI00088519DB|nr:flagellar biosynthetic protein FliO [Geodermatophilus sp. DSM 45219]SDN43999.1 flagellar protein FliO/FliZ [Geodermatophilus sp. DSM 45219]
MTWMVVRLVLSLAFIGAVLWFAARVAQKRGVGQGNGLIEVVARQRMGRASSVSVVRIADRVLVVGSTEEQVTLLAEVDGDLVAEAMAERRPATAAPAAAGVPALAGSVFDRNGWTTFVAQLRERTVRR